MNGKPRKALSPQKVIRQTSDDGPPGHVPVRCGTCGAAFWLPRDAVTPEELRWVLDGQGRCTPCMIQQGGL